MAVKSVTGVRIKLKVNQSNRQRHNETNWQKDSQNLLEHSKLNREWTSQVLEWFYLTREIDTAVEYYALLCTNSIVFFCLLVYL